MSVLGLGAAKKNVWNYKETNLEQTPNTSLHCCVNPR